MILALACIVDYMFRFRFVLALVMAVEFLMGCKFPLRFALGILHQVIVEKYFLESK